LYKRYEKWVKTVHNLNTFYLFMSRGTVPLRGVREDLQASEEFEKSPALRVREGAAVPLPSLPLQGQGQKEPQEPPHFKALLVNFQLKQPRETTIKSKTLHMPLFFMYIFFLLEVSHTNF
jgi:hypothetical protein